MNADTLRKSALQLLCMSTNASYTARQAVKDARELEREVEAALDNEKIAQALRESRLEPASGAAEEMDDGA